jgi:hypothetical protein
MSKNAASIDQIKLACKYVYDLIEQGVTENYAIRTMELMVDSYAKFRVMGNAKPNNPDEVPLWSREARRLRAFVPSATGYFIVEHGTPRRTFARLVLNLYRNNLLTEAGMNELVDRYWKLAVLTLEEDGRLNRIARSGMSDRPEDRWKLAGITF